MLGLFTGVSAAQGPAMPDPRAMSGVPRVDPQTPPGTIVVRVLRGSFQDPGVGLTVSLELRSADGSRTETRTAVSVEQGRAPFTDLNAYAGGTAVASVDFGDERVQSQELRVDPSVGVRMLLVKGAAGEASGAGAAPATGDVPRPGVAFPNPGQEQGTVVVGTLDLGGGRPFTGVEVRLEISPPEGPKQVRTVNSDARGAARFAGLGDVPPGSKLVAEATLNGQLRRSEPFVLEGQEHGLAVVLAAERSARDGVRAALNTGTMIVMSVMALRGRSMRASTASSGRTCRPARAKSSSSTTTRPTPRPRSRVVTRPSVSSPSRGRARTRPATTAWRRHGGDGSSSRTATASPGRTGCGD